MGFLKHLILKVQSMSFYLNETHLSRDPKITVIFKFRQLRMFDFRILYLCYVGTHVCYICW